MQCLKWLYIIFYNYINIIFSQLYVFLFNLIRIINGGNLNLLYVLIPLSLETKIKIPSIKRIGPHNIDILSLIIGSVLGDSHLEKRIRGLGTRVIFEQSNKNVEDLMWFHNYLASRGDCSINRPKLHKRIKKDNKVFIILE